MDTNTPASSANQFPELEAITLPWLHPISDSQPAGSAAKYEPGYEIVVGEVGKLDAISGGEVNWPLVVEHAGQILHDVSKDLIIACNLAYGLHRTDGLNGCVQGVVLVSRLMETYWQEMFPPIKRLRGRIGTLAWLVSRIEIDLELVEPTESDRHVVGLLDMAAQQLDSTIKNLLDGEGPSLRPLRRVIERLVLSLPAVSANNVPGTTTETTVAPTLTEDLPTVLPGVSPDAAAAQVLAPDAPATLDAQASSDAPTPQAASAPAQNAKSDSEVKRDELRGAIKDYLIPISEENPSGSSAKYEPGYEWITVEIAKLDSLSGGSVDWSGIAERSSDILTSNSKDISIAVYAAAAWYETQGLAGLCRGLSLLAEITDTYWDTMFPPLRRLRARSGSFSWFFQRVEQGLSDYVPGAKERATLADLKLATKRLDGVIQEKFDGDGPSLRPMTKTLERVEMSLPAPKHEAPPPAAAPEQTPAASQPSPPDNQTSQAPAPVRPPPQAQPAKAISADALGTAPKAFEDGQNVGKYLSQVGKSLTSTAALLRKSTPASPTAYRLVRLGAWLHLSQLPPADARGQTKIPPPPAPLASRLEKMAANGKWQAILEETESAVTQYRFWFDLNRYAAQALTGLGPEYRETRLAVESELAAFLHRLPDAQDLLFADGTSFADASTKEWLSDEVMPSGDGGSASVDDEATDNIVTKAQSLAKDSKLSDALSLLATEATQTINHRQQFRMRLSLAKMANSGGQATIAHAHYQSLFEEIERRDLEQWEPSLAIECIHGYLMTVRKLTEGDKALLTTEAMLLGRLCVLSPAMAITQGT